MTSYQDSRDAFDWNEILAALDWPAHGPVNVASTLADRHADSPHVALDWRGKNGERRRLSFAELAERSARFAGLLAARGVGKGDRVAMIMPRVPETVIAMLGIWRAGAIYVPIFSAFGADAICMRLHDSGAKLLLTHTDYADGLGTARAAVSAVIVVGDGYDDAMAAAEPADPVPMNRRDPACLLYTSGSTGTPKGVIIATNFVASIAPAIRHCADLKPGDVFWPSGDPAWGYGMICYANALAFGCGVTMWQAQPNAEAALDFLAANNVTNLATVPTLLRGIMALGVDRVRAADAPVRRIWSCGEPLNAEAVRFFRDVWGTPPLDTYGSSEMGLPVGNLAALPDDVRPGSMGRPLPGHWVDVIDDAGERADDDTVGLIGLAHSEQGFYATHYWNNEALTDEVFGQRWIVTNDLGRRDADGFLWFEGRSDDVIKSAGYRIGPFEVESALLEHPAVAEAGVVGKPDDLRGHLIMAYVVLVPGQSGNAALEEELAKTVRGHLGAHAVPRAFAFVTELPKTESGKIQRFKLRSEAAET
ncbi:MAG: acyl-CoA synthetase [Alphaproteobacteria bacterium]